MEESEILRLIDATTKLCATVAESNARVEQLLIRSEERTIKVSEIFEKQSKVMDSIANLSTDFRANYKDYIDKLVIDRDQIRTEYKALVEQATRESAEMRKDRQRDHEIVERLIDKIASGTTINNK